MRAVDLGGIYTGELSLRRLQVLVRGLPADSRTSTLLRKLQREAGLAKATPIEELPAEAYSNAEWLLQKVHDELRTLIWLYLKANFQDPPHEPEFLPRPGDPVRRRKKVNAWFGAFGVPLLPADPPQPAPDGPQPAAGDQDEVSPAEAQLVT